MYWRGYPFHMPHFTCHNYVDEMTADLSKELWYHGRVSRADAEHLLEQRGNVEGSYLVRDSLTTTGEYVLSLCHQVCVCECYEVTGASRYVNAHMLG